VSRSTLSPIPSPASTTLTTIVFFDPTTGYGGFTRSEPAGRQCEYLVGKTADGGKQFGSLVTVTSWACDADQPNATRPPSSLAFDDHGDGFSYDPQLFVTHDSGKSWTPSPQPGIVLSIAALGHSVWMIETDFSKSAPESMAGCPIELLESLDGGRSWTPTPTQPPGATLSALGLNTGSIANGQTWLVRTSPTSAYVLASPVFNPTGTTSVAPMWFTANGGASWSERTVPCGISAMSVVLSSAPDGSLTAVCATQPGAGNQIKSTVHSTDGGQTWAVHLTCAPSSITCTSNPSSNPSAGGYVGEIDALSGNVAFLVGDRNSVQVTRNSGVNWAPVQPVIGDTAGGPTQLIFFDGSNGVVLGNSNGGPTIWSTSDGGAHCPARSRKQPERRAVLSRSVRVASVRGRHRRPAHSRRPEAVVLGFRVDAG
jgi:photosystem II stability/assembly factor-like uncharacterized protein